MSCAITGRDGFDPGELPRDDRRRVIGPVATDLGKSTSALGTCVARETLARRPARDPARLVDRVVTQALRKSDP